MLRLKRAMIDCNIPHKPLCKATGYGKTQISLTLATGKFPADADKFRQGVRTLISTSVPLNEWMECCNFGIDDLLEVIPDTAPNAKHNKGAAASSAPTNPPADLSRLLHEIAGCSICSGKYDSPLLRVTRIAHRLLTTLRDLAGHDAPYMVRLESDCSAILTGESEASHG